MLRSAIATASDWRTRPMLNKVPEVTIYFWIIKILCTTVGETAADFLNSSLNLGLTGTTVVMGILLAIIFTFALGTAAGDLTAERLNLGYLVSAIIFFALIASVTVAHVKFKLNA